MLPGLGAEGNSSLQTVFQFFPQPPPLSYGLLIFTACVKDVIQFLCQGCSLHPCLSTDFPEERELYAPVHWCALCLLLPS